MFDPVKLRDAGLKPRHVAHLLGVSRVTASNWLRGVTAPHRLIQDRTEALAKAVQQAVDDKKLPVSDKLLPEERSVRTVALVRRYMDALERDEDGGPSE